MTGQKMPWEEFSATMPAKAEGEVMPWEEFARPAQTAPSPIADTAKDVAKSIPGGLAKGVNTLLGMPADISSFIGNLSATGLEKLVGFLSPEEGEKVKAAREALRRVDEAGGGTALRGLSRLPGSDDLNKVTQGALGEYHKPETTAGEYAQTIAEFGAGAAGPGLAAKGGRAIARGLGMDLAPSATTLGDVAKTGLKYGVLPGVASESAGQAAEGTSWEPFARAAAPLIVGGGMAARDILTSNRPLIEAFSQVKPEHRDAGVRFMEEAREAGVPITAAQAINQVSGGAYPRLLEFQRLAEGSRKGGDILAEFMKESQGGAKRLYSRVAEEVGPVPEAPFEVAPRVKQAAAKQLKEVRDEINAEAKPFYEQSVSEPLDTLSDETAEWLAGSPLFRHYASSVNADPVLKEAIKKGKIEPGTVGYIDLLKKAVDDDLKDLTAPTVGRKNFKIGELTEFKDRLTQIADDAAPNDSYAEARRIGAEGRQNVLAPLERAPTGQLADVSDIPEAWKQQARTLFGAETPGAAPQAAEAMATVMKTDPDAGRALARMYLEKKFEQATQNLVSGENYWGPAKFAKEVIGDKGKRESFAAVMREVNPQAEPALDFMFKVFEAQGRREGKGSRTAGAAQLTEEMKDSAPGVLAGAARAASRVGWNPFSWVGLGEKPLQSMALNYNMKLIAQALTDPATTEKIMKITRLAPQAPGTALRLTSILNQSMMQSEKSQSGAMSASVE